mmetsp:Transcript_18512/g.27068  ORF Transcript_18512/g.27068 Transcript_18512/m.27068 type:complete len:247 (-) Transcript_18512:1157-1897(-)
MASAISLIILPAPAPTIVAPRILSEPASVRMRTIPTSASSQMARSLSSKCFSYVSNLIPRSLRSPAYKPTEAISGSVNVAYGMSKDDTCSLPRNRVLRMTIRAIKSAACVNLYSLQQSPTPKIFLLVVCKRSLTVRPSLVSYFTPASSRPIPVTFGLRPAATRKASQIILLVLPFSSIWITNSGWPLSRIFPVNAIDLYLDTLRRKSTPSRANCFFTSKARSSSSFGSTLPDLPSTVTWVPRRCID